MSTEVAAAVFPRRGLTLAEADARASRWFVHGALFATLILQRFCLYVGASPIYLCLIVFIVLLGWLLVTGRAALRPVPFGLFALAAAIGVVSTLVAVNTFDLRIPEVSFASLLSLLALYMGLVIGPTQRFDGSKVFDIFIRYVRLCAVLGLIQYVAQFAGIKLFSFMISLPALKPVLVEPLFNYWPILAYGSSVLRSNGFFLVEPSTFSQLLALGLLVDVFVRRELRFVPLYAGAYLVSYAGTGMLALGLTCALYPLVSPSGSGRILLFGILLLPLGAAVWAIFPDQFSALADRANEVQYEGSSGYARYVGQFSAFDAVWGETRTLIGYGPGSFERAVFYTPGSGNPVVKLFIDYGVFGLIAFLAFFVSALWRRDIMLVVLFAFVNFQFGGGNLLFPPFVILSAVLCIWSAPQALRRAATAEPSRAVTVRSS
ncbi:hypothetical protein [Glacieibacterium sp.]|uniref:hypothetical protein n=1 Tax=Glacieibacterium sp. TaxID=2860237 RepID=UPI003B0037C1